MRRGQNKAVAASAATLPAASRSILRITRGRRVDWTVGPGEEVSIPDLADAPDPEQVQLQVWTRKLLGPSEFKNYVVKTTKLFFSLRSRKSPNGVGTSSNSVGTALRRDDVEFCHTPQTITNPDNR